MPLFGPKIITRETKRSARPPSIQAQTGFVEFWRK